MHFWKNLNVTNSKSHKFQFTGIPDRDRTTWPTVVDALSQACGAYDVKYTISSDALSVESINDLGQTDDGMFWAWTLNGKEVSGRAGSTRVNENDVIVFSYENVNASK